MGPGVCQCCERAVENIHWMEWDDDLSWLCDNCMGEALEEDDAIPHMSSEPSS